MRSSGMRTLVDATPDTRDRAVDLARAGAMVIVVTVNVVAMTVYIWHVTALLAVATRWNGSASHRGRLSIVVRAAAVLAAGALR